VRGIIRSDFGQCKRRLGGLSARERTNRVHWSTSTDVLHGEARRSMFRYPFRLIGSREIGMLARVFPLDRLSEGN
jgi:hypothetical protein